MAGYFAAYRLPDLLYDLYKLDETAPRAHGELISSAYTAALDLSFEEEAILDAAMQRLAARTTWRAHPAVYDALSGVEGFRGFYVDKLKGRVGTLRSLDAADSGPWRRSSLAPTGRHRRPQRVGDATRRGVRGGLVIAKLTSRWARLLFRVGRPSSC